MATSSVHCGGREGGGVEPIEICPLRASFILVADGYERPRRWKEHGREGNMRAREDEKNDASQSHALAKHEKWRRYLRFI